MPPADRRQFTVRLLCAGVLVALAGICYSSWVLEFLWASPLDPLRSFLSELDAAHRPHRGWYIAGDVTTSICAIGAAALMLVPRPAVGGVAARGAIVALALFGVATITDALSPIECIPHIDADCPEEPSGLLPQLHHIHALTSTVAVFAIFGAMILGVLAAWRTPVWPLLRHWGLAVLVVIAVATVWMLAADDLHGDYRLGLAQRIQVGGMSVWLMLWGVAVATQRRSTTPASGSAR
ncbi:DUF998 domain-containing protein [Gordonia sp. NB41Y]|uniref:DUF998 domain-containing protein n=1 Tax=Gordonia sp. NB41Y TaxID=875808 RepID=UPI0002BED6B0|nr:DUF998 domain-containing protein [Gordonia sp. NB41Y]EMP13705.1 hypothetical protein ISGA_468 [Gordonia sp. NB41Y]WLP90478.1 DUF998 domain-containing protein [Gordonia sp. NB41Y]